MLKLPLIPMPPSASYDRYRYGLDSTDNKVYPEAESMPKQKVKRCGRPKADGKPCRRKIAVEQASCVDHNPKFSIFRPGRPAVLEEPQKVLVQFEQRQLVVLDRFAQGHQLAGRSAALRHILDHYDFSVA